MIKPLEVSFFLISDTQCSSRWRQICICICSVCVCLYMLPVVYIPPVLQCSVETLDNYTLWMIYMVLLNYVNPLWSVLLFAWMLLYVQVFVRPSIAVISRFCIPWPDWSRSSSSKHWTAWSPEKKNIFSSVLETVMVKMTAFRVRSGSFPPVTKSSPMYYCFLNRSSCIINV